MNLNVSDFVDRLKKFSPLKDFEKIGFSQNTINNWKFRNSFPKVDDLYKIATFLNVSLDWLLTGEINENATLSDKENELIKNYRALDNHDKQSISLMTEALANRKLELS